MREIPGNINLCEIQKTALKGNSTHSTEGPIHQVTKLPSVPGPRFGLGPWRRSIDDDDGDDDDDDDDDNNNDKILLQRMAQFKGKLSIPSRGALPSKTLPRKRKTTATTGRTNQPRSQGLFVDEERGPGWGWSRNSPRVIVIF